MAMHTDLPIHKAAFDLLSMATDITRNIPRDFKAGLGAKVRDECIEVMVLIARANAAKDKRTHLATLGARLNPSKTILQPVDRGVDFVGHVIKPWRRTTRKRSVAQALTRTATAPAADLRETANSYFGLLSQASHSEKDRAKLARLILKRGHSVNAALTKTYPKG